MNNVIRVSFNVKPRTRDVCQETRFDSIKTSLYTAIGSIELSHTVLSVTTDQNLKSEHDE